jgi:myosin heavy subunit
MSRAEQFQETLFHLGDLARDRLVGKPGCPRSMQRVLRAEELLLARRRELEELKQRVAKQQATWRELQARLEHGRAKQEAVLEQHKGQVQGVLRHSKSLRRQRTARREELLAARQKREQLEARYSERLEAGVSLERLTRAREQLERQQATQLRLADQLAQVEEALQQVLTPEPGQPGGPGVLAHRRLLELEQEAQLHEQEHERWLAELEQAIADKEAEIQAAEEFLEQALFLLGEEVYALRLPDPELAVYYLRLDGLRR